MSRSGRQASRDASFLLRGGALVVGFSLAGCVTPGKGAGQPTQRGQRAPKAGPPDADASDTWLAIHADNTATLYTGFAELGQGSTTALLQVAAEELDLAWTRSAPHRSTRMSRPTRAAPIPAHPCSAAARRSPPPRPRPAPRCWRARPTQLGCPWNASSVERGSVSVTGTPRRSRHLWRTDRRRALRTRHHRQGAVEAGRRIPAGGQAPAARGPRRQGQRPARLHPATAPAGHAARAHRASARPGRYGAGARVLRVDDTALARYPRRAAAAQGRFPRRGRAARMGCGARRAGSWWWSGKSRRPCRAVGGLHAQMRARNDHRQRGAGTRRRARGGG